MTSQRLEVSYATWSELVSAPERLELLLTVGNGYRRYFRNAESGFDTLSRHRIDSYLVDFDVVAEIAAVDESGDISEQTIRKRHSLYSWFRLAREQQKFFLPWGAYQELLNTILVYVNLKHGIEEFSKHTADLDGLRALMEIAKAIGIDLPNPQPDREYLAAAITSQLNSATNKLVRLGEFLELQTFSGVRAKFDNRIYDCFLRWVRACPRRKLNRFNEWIVTTNRTNDDRDKYDAMNMAIALESVISRRDGEPRCVLVTSTQFILDLVHPNEWLLGDLTDVPEERHPDLSVKDRQLILNDLRSALQLRNAQRCFACLPFIHPRQALCAELVGYFKNRDIGEVKLKEIQSQLGKLVEHISAYQSLDLQQEGSNEKSFLEKRRLQIASLIEKVAARFDGDSESTMQKLEDLRATSASLGKQIVFDESCDVTVGSVNDSIEAASTLFLYHVSKVRERAWASVEYTFKLSSASNSHSRFCVRESLQDVMGETILEGDILRSYVSENLTTYTYRVRTYSFLSQFLDFIGRILSEAKLVVAADKFVPMDDVAQDSVDRLCIFCGKEWLGMPLVIGSESSVPLTEKFRQAISVSRVTRKLLGNDIQVPAHVEQVRLVRPGYEISFDCELLECDLIRHVRFLANSPHLELLCQIVEAFHPRSVDGKRLLNSLEKVLGNSNGME